jgi:hypothetical protein
MHFENGLDLVLVVRAARLLQPLLERAYVVRTTT